MSATEQKTSFLKDFDFNSVKDSATRGAILAFFVAVPASFITAPETINVAQLLLRSWILGLGALMGATVASVAGDIAGQFTAATLNKKNLAKKFALTAGLILGTAGGIGGYMLSNDDINKMHEIAESYNAAQLQTPEARP